MNMAKETKVKPEQIGDLTADSILDYCAANGHAKWLQETANKTKKVKNKKTLEETTKRIGFFELRKEFAKKFFPELIPEKKKKNKTFYDKIMELKTEE